MVWGLGFVVFCALFGDLWPNIVIHILPLPAAISPWLRLTRYVINTCELNDTACYYYPAASINTVFYKHL